MEGMLLKKFEAVEFYVEFYSFLSYNVYINEETISSRKGS